MTPAELFRNSRREFLRKCGMGLGATAMAAMLQHELRAAPVAVEPYATQPETGHASRRIGMNVGQRDGSAFVELNARASYHDLLEPDAGYTPDAQIELLSLAVRWYEDSSRQLQCTGYKHQYGLCE